MSPDAIFPYANMAAMAGWVVLILVPRRFSWALMVPALGVPVVLSVLYSGLVLAYFFQVEGGGYGTLSEVMALFDSREVALAGWVHYLAFDLLIGAALARQMDGQRVHRLVQAPVLLAVFMFGPLGWLMGTAFCALRARQGAPVAQEV